MTRTPWPLPEFDIVNPEAPVPTEAVELVAAMLMSIVDAEDAHLDQEK